MSKSSLAICLLLLAPPAFSACTQGNLKGTWKDYVLGLGSQTVAECKYVIDKYGSINSATCYNYSAISDYPPIDITSGYFLVDRQCHIDGSVGANNGVTAFFRGQLDRSFNSFTGISRNSTGNIAMHNFMRQ